MLNRQLAIISASRLMDKVPACWQEIPKQVRDDN
jgi:hypothetical protein